MDVPFQDKVARAREAGSHILIEETRHIADDAHNDFMAKRLKDGDDSPGMVGYVINGEHVSRSKLRIEQRWREAESILPKVYGKQTNTNLTGGLTITDGNSEALMQDILDMLATGRVKLPGGIELFAVDDEPGSDDCEFA